MLPHHLDAIHRVTEHFQQDPEVLALLLGGSLAHGFGSATSDVDLMLVVAEHDHARRTAENRMHYFSRDWTAYEGGYVDGKYITAGFVRQVAERGSEPARFAFSGARVLFSRIPGFEADVERAAQYPAAGQSERLRRFFAQFEAWHWYAGEALRLQNPYLLATAVSKFVLFSGRLVLCHNQLLYPYHKWFLRVLAQAPAQPPGLLACLQAVLDAPTAEHVQAAYILVKDFQPWVTGDFSWPTQFMVDSELSWQQAAGIPVDDI